MGRPPGGARRAADRRAGGAGQRAGPGGREGLPTAGAGVAAGGDPLPQFGGGGRGRSRGRHRQTWRSSRRRCSTSWPASGPPSSSAACVWSVRTATISNCGSAINPRKALPATVNRGRWRCRCGWRPTNCFAPREAIRCCCSTTCSPNSTPRAGAHWSRSAASAEQVLVTAAVAEDIPAGLGCAQNRDRHARRRHRPMSEVIG